MKRVSVRVFDQIPLGKALAYKILKDIDPKMFDLQDTQVIPADAMRHLYDAERATSIRGLPWAYHGMNSALDVMDIVALEKAAVKLHSSMSGAIKKKSGTAGNGGFTGDLLKLAGDDRSTVNLRSRRLRILRAARESSS
jgi:capsid protein